MSDRDSTVPESAIISQLNLVNAPAIRGSYHQRPLNVKRHLGHRFCTLEKFSYRVSISLNATDPDNIAHPAGEHLTVLKRRKERFGIGRTRRPGTGRISG
jgi:hypothetical protein